MRERSGRFQRAIINIFPRVKLGRRLLSEFVPEIGSGIKGGTHDEEEESNLEISECYTFPRFPFGSRLISPREFESIPTESGTRSGFYSCRCVCTHPSNKPVAREVNQCSPSPPLPSLPPRPSTLLHRSLAASRIGRWQRPHRFWREIKLW